MNENIEKLFKLCEILDYRFRKIELLRVAVTHPSYKPSRVTLESAGHNYQRLEFLGDKVVNLLAAEWLFDKYPHVSEGKLTRYLSMVVNNNQLGKVAENMGLADFIRMGNFAESDNLRHDKYILACVLEAVFGSIFVDTGGGYIKIKQLLVKNLLQEFDPTVLSEREFDPKGYLQRLAQDKFNTAPVYEVVSRDLTAGVVVRVLLHEQIVGSSRAGRARDAEKAAAFDALEQTHDLTRNLPFALIKQRDITKEVGFTIR